MNAKRIEEIQSDYKKAIERLQEVLDSDMDNSGFLVDATIQRFEFTFELAWKLLKKKLNDLGVNANSPKMVLKEAYQNELIQNEHLWLDMLEARNQSSHIYDESLAKKLYQDIQSKFFPLLSNL